MELVDVHPRTNSTPPEVVLRARCRRRPRSLAAASRSGSAPRSIVKHENHNPTGAFKVRGGLTYRRRAEAPRAGGEGAHFGDARQSRPEPRLRGASRRARADDLRPAAAIRSRRTRRCARSAPRSSNTATTSRPRARRRSASPRRAASSSSRPSIAISCAASRPTRSSCCAPIPISTCSMSRSARARASAAASPRATRSGLKTEIVGVQASGAPAYALSFAAGRVGRDQQPPTRSPTAWRRAPPTPRRSTSSRKGVARIALVSDDEIAAAIRAYWTRHAQSRRGRRRRAARGGDAGERPAQGQEGRPRALRRQHRFRAVSTLDRRPAPSGIEL